MKLALIFTLDYELFGNGTGSVSREQIIPTNQLLDIFDQYGAKLTIFFEYGQFLGYKKFIEENNNFEQDNIKIAQQLIDAVKRGHDVQFHYHPTWHNVKYEHNKFILDEALFDISDLTDDEIESIFRSGKQYLENLLKPFASDYECNSFRAGAWSMRDNNRVLSLLRKCGFKADSSVAPNAYFKSSYGDFDYRRAPQDYGYWNIQDDLLIPSSDRGMLELAIYTKKDPFAFLKYYNSHYLNSKKIISRFYKTKVSEKKLSFFQKIKKVIGRSYYMADFNTMSHQTLLDMIDNVCQKYKDTDEIIPLILIGHSKSSYFNDELHLLFQKLSQYEYIEYKNISEVARELI